LELGINQSYHEIDYDLFREWHFAFEIWSNGCEAYLVIFVFYISRMGLANGKRFLFKDLGF
jgi:hypothetical protein